MSVCAIKQEMDNLFIAKIERAEVLAWKNMYDIAPADFRQRMQMSYKEIGGGLALRLDAIPAAHFNMAIGLGVSEPMTKEMVDEIMEMYSRKRPRSFMILHFDKMIPQGCEELLVNYGLNPVNCWERIVRQGGRQSIAIPNPENLRVVTVDDGNMQQWAQFICKAYNLPFHEWLHSMVGSEGWYHFMAVRTDGTIAAARSWFISPDGWAWSGVEAPVPGIMTPHYAPDFLVWEQAINELDKLGVSYYVADIELISKAHDLPSYTTFSSHFGFTIPYLRLHYTRNLPV